jgi:hypothetical protein
VALLDRPVFVRLAGLDPRRGRVVVLEQRPIALRQRAPAAAFEIVRRRRQIVRPEHLRHAAEIPERALDPRCHVRAARSRTTRLAWQHRNLLRNC